MRPRRRRLLRHAFTLCSAISLVLCVAVCVLWVRSYWCIDTLYLIDRRAEDTSERLVNLMTFPGGVYYFDQTSFYRGFATPGSRREYGLMTDPPYGSNPGARWPGAVRFGGIVWAVDDRAVTPSTGEFDLYRSKMRGLVVPGWALMLVFLVLPACWIVSRVRAARVRRTGGCPTCGYDLRAHKPGERCPECGAGVA